MDTEKLKSAVLSEVEKERQALIELSLRLHANPEIGFKEEKAAAWLSHYLEQKGFRLERGVAGMATAFRASYGQGRPAVAFLAEYDALPQIGHGCGHNIIAAAAAGAGIAARLAADKSSGMVQVIGTPAEEMYGGKVIMAQRGVFSDLDAAMLVHPGSRDTAYTRALACAIQDVEFFGVASHAAAHPEEGVNALEAMLLAFNSINALRQHIKDGSRIHGIITHGGDAANIVPAHTAAHFLVRAREDAYLNVLQGRVLNCFKAAALATGCRLEHRLSDIRYAAMRTNRPLAEAFSRNLVALGRKPQPPDAGTGLGSTDMGNVSAVVPSVHAFVSIVPPTISEHSTGFAAAAASETGHRGLIDGAKAMAMTAIELLTDSQLMAQVKADFLAGGSD
ncbi:MAG: M20 family metallopeptidase [Chloroflexi bacterium]|nr:M20 family metallopeptidase [Chloroflexota bacterium]